MTDFGKANCRNQSHVSGADYTDGNWLYHALEFSLSLFLVRVGKAGKSRDGIRGS
jgi:hypothetical protein